MNIKTSLMRRPPGTIIPRLVSLGMDAIYDYRHGLSSSGPLSSKVAPLRKLLREIKPLMPSHPVMVDFGCRYGRPLFVAAEFGFVAARGIEIDAACCVQARRNLAIYTTQFNPRTLLEIIEGDVTLYEIQPDENIFFFFNPFGVNVLAPVLDNIMASLDAHPRNVMILCYNPHAIGPMRRRTGFEKLIDKDMWGERMTVLGNSDAGRSNLAYQRFI